MCQEEFPWVSVFLNVGGDLGAIVGVTLRLPVAQRDGRDLPEFGVPQGEWRFLGEWSCVMKGRFKY